MKTAIPKSKEHVAKLQVFCDGELQRTFYCIYDADFQHWMSKESFDGLIWTKDILCRQEFDSRTEAQERLDALVEWRRERDPE